MKAAEEARRLTFAEEVEPRLNSLSAVERAAFFTRMLYDYNMATDAITLADVANEYMTVAQLRDAIS